MSDFDLNPLRSLLDHLAPRGETALLPALHAAQSVYGYLPEEVAAEVGRALKVPLADVYGVIDFYAMFYSEPVGKTIIRVCNDPPCSTAGGDEVLNTVCRHLRVAPNEVSPDNAYTVERAPCLGLCEHAPAVLVGDTAIGRANTEKAGEIIQGMGERPHGVVGGDIRILTANCGKAKPTSLNQYVENGGYRGLRKAIAIKPEDIIAEVKAAGLVGRGGAAFPTGIKWEGAFKADGKPKYVVCNADESEPGTFKDRVLMEEDPHRTIEGMIIAAYAIGAHEGYFYIRGEYPYGYKVMSTALDEARQAGYLGENILDSGFDFDIEMRMGAGAYICGEETALFESIEGKRGFPRVKPPFPTTYGLFGKPTVINNVETFCNVPYILEYGASEYRNFGTEKSPGPKLFCVSGDVARPGLYEVPFGVTLRHLLDDLAGGVTGGSLQAILFGGAAGAFATEENLNVRMTFEDLRAQGLPLGSGVVMVFNQQRDLRHVFKGLAHFFADESCGKCYPCQIGTQRQYEILSRLAEGDVHEQDVDRLTDVGWTMVDASLCGLGQTAATAVLSAMKLWPELFTNNDRGKTSKDQY
ncbi:MAG TPA: NADH-quinone oxidoreductase subunit NuoF [Anaerolineales bacterium]